jgi:hypothetical protein
MRAKKNDVRPTMHTKASCHWCPACCVFVHILFEIIFADDFHLISLDSKIGTEDSTGNPSTVSAVAEVASTMAREEFRIVHFDSDGTAETMALHL